jgi:hypothetical protein
MLRTSKRFETHGVFALQVGGVKYTSQFFLFEKLESVALRFYSSYSIDTQDNASKRATAL